MAGRVWCGSCDTELRRCKDGTYRCPACWERYRQARQARGRTKNGPQPVKAKARKKG